MLVSSENSEHSPSWHSRVVSTFGCSIQRIRESVDPILICSAFTTFGAALTCTVLSFKVTDFKETDHKETLREALDGATTTLSGARLRYFYEILGIGLYFASYYCCRLQARLWTTP